VFLTGAITACPPAEDLVKIYAPDAESRDSFGMGPAIFGNLMLVPAPWDATPCGFASGSVYLIDITDPEHPVLLHWFTAGEYCAPLQYFGISTALDGNFAVIGSHTEDNGRGAVYVFDAETGERLHRLVAEPGDPGGNFGQSVAISGNIIIVGASYDSSHGHHAGAAYLFDVTTGQQLCELVRDDPQPDDFFGFSVAISGNLATVGAYGDDDHTGSAYVFDVTTCQQLYKLTPDDLEPGDQFGVSVSMSGTTAVIGADGGEHHPTNPGAAYVFDLTTYEQTCKLMADDGVPGDAIGISVSCSGDLALVGARYANGYAGAAYLFRLSTCEQLCKLAPDDLEPGDEFGFVAIDGNRFVIGAPYCDDLGNLTGAVYVGAAGASSLVAPLDIKPGSCPNPFNRKSNGKLPVALLGSDVLDVMAVDPGSLALSRTDGIGGSVMPLGGNHAPRYGDAGTPYDGEACGCHELEGDGILDLKMRFSRQEMVEVLDLYDLMEGMRASDGTYVELVLTGTLLDGTPFSAYDCIWVNQ
jgi:outer membrane protein assembly factor BamB